MLRSIVVLGTAFAVACASADDKVTADKAAREKAELKKRAEGYLRSPPGVHLDPEKDVTDGRHVRLFVVGDATISTVLGIPEGLEIAREKAEESAKAEYVKWLGSKVTLRKSAANETLLLKEGDSTAGGPREQGKIVERRTKEYEETAAGLVRGLKLVSYEQKGAERKIVVVYRWDAGPSPAEAKGPSTAKPADPVIPDKKVIIDDAP